MSWTNIKNGWAMVSPWSGMSAPYRSIRFPVSLGGEAAKADARILFF
jgi:hypothetical protein